MSDIPHNCEPADAFWDAVDNFRDGALPNNPDDIVGNAEARLGYLLTGHQRTDLMSLAEQEIAAQHGVDTLEAEPYTSPAAWARKAKLFAEERGEVNPGQLRRIGDCAETVMSFALEFPDKTDVELTEGSLSWLGHDETLRPVVSRYVSEARILLKKGLLVDDHELKEGNEGE